MCYKSFTAVIPAASFKPKTGHGSKTIGLQASSQLWLQGGIAPFEGYSTFFATSYRHEAMVLASRTHQSATLAGGGLCLT